MNHAADALSRLYAIKVACLAIDVMSDTLYKEIQSSWHKDTTLIEIIAKLDKGEPVQHYSWQADQLGRKGKIMVGNNPTLRIKIVNLYHESALGGHSSIHNTYQQVSALFYWKGMLKIIRECIRTCDICQRFKSDNTAYPSKLQCCAIN